MITWYLPSLYGDIRLESQGKGRTRLTIHGLSPEEKVALRALLKKAAHPGPFQSAWATPAELASLSLDKTTETQTLCLLAPILDVQKILSKALKPTRKQLSAVRFSGGKIEEVTESTIGLIETVSESVDTAVTAGAAPAGGREADTAESATATPTAASVETARAPRTTTAKAATVAPPVRGCPAPDFAAIEVRATAVMRAFLTPIQISDFEKFQAFIAVGGDTGHRYQLTSRHARSKLAEVRRTLYDLDERRAYCVHDWEVPAPEELLAILLCLHLPGRERYLRAIPE